MMLNLTDVLLENRKIKKEVPIGLEQFTFRSGCFPVTEKTAALIEAHKDEQSFLVIRGTAKIGVRIPCDRCLDDVEVPLELEFSQKVPAERETGSKEADESPGDADTQEESAFEPDYYLEGYNLDVDKLLFGEALLNWPSRVLCKEDCRGLCPVCGQNLNHGDCGCERKALDPRMAKVLDVFSKFKEV